MSIEGKHAYRFGYLKSEAWSNVRLEALAREKGKCQICGEESISNDAHHVWYPENIYETTEQHLVILCRPCHEFCHSMLPECKTKDEADGMEQWRRFKNAVIVWRRERMRLFNPGDGTQFFSAKDLRTAYESLRDKTTKLERQLSEYRNQFGIVASIEESELETSANQWKLLQKILFEWRNKIHRHEEAQKSSVDNGDYRI